MTAANSLWAQLNDSEHRKLESLLVQFDRSWDDKQLAARVRELPPAGSPLRLPALVEMVKIDLEKQWALGRRPRLEGYLQFYPELGTPETVPVDLIQAEIEVRRQFAATVDLPDFGRRFPRQAERLQQMVTGSLPVTAASREPADLPETFGRYRILKKLGQGGMGAVYLAQDTQLDRRVALKVPRFKPGDNAAMLERFYREARAAATLSHPNLCPVHDVGQIDGVHFLTMGYIEGRPLADFTGQPLPQPQVAAVVRQLALALQEAHARGVVHRDLKPANVMINRRREPVIMDFGLARRTNQAEARLTQDGHFLGTPAYMAPEQVRGEPDEMGPSCDIYALGVILYEMLTGALPFQGPIIAVVAQIISQDPEPPSRRRPDLDPRLEAVCLKAMAKKAEDRYATMTELANALGEFLQTPTQQADTAADSANLAAEMFAGLDAIPGASYPTRAVRTRPAAERKRLLPWLIAGALAAALPLAAVAIYLNIGKSEPNDPTQPAAVKADDRPPKDPEWIADATGKLPVPDAAVLRATQAKLREAYRGELASGKPEDRVRLVQTLLERATAAEQVPARYALLDLARQTAAESGDLAAALDICGRMNQAFLLDFLPLKVRTMDEAAQSMIGWTLERRVAFRKTGLSIGFEALAVDDYSSAAEVAKVFQPRIENAAEKSGRDEWTYQVRFLAEEAARGGPAYQRVRPFLDTLAARPDDPRASTEAGKYQCFIKNDWTRGLRLLSQGDDPVLRDVAEREQKTPTAAADLLAVADAWWDAAEKADPADAADYRRRARVWYLKALGKTPAPGRAELARRVQPRIDSIPVRPVTLHMQFRGAGGSPSVVISNEGVNLRPTWAMREFSVNHLTAPGGTAFKQHRNTGAWRLFPDAIDFGSAEFLHENTYRFGAMTYSVEPHQLIIQLYSKTTSTYDADFTVTFQAAGFVVAGRFDDQWEIKYFKWEPTGSNKRDVRIADEWAAIQAGPPIVEQRRSQIDFMACREVSYWPRLPPPAPQVPFDHFALVGTTEWDLPAGRYEVRTLADDGIRILIDDKKVLERWKYEGTPPERNEVPLTAGKHRIRVEYFQQTGAARLQFALRRIGDLP